jgi:hypothetical protein
MSSFEPLNIAVPREKERKVPAPLIIFGEVLFSYRVGVQGKGICNVEPLLNLKLQSLSNPSVMWAVGSPESFVF